MNMTATSMNFIEMTGKFSMPETSSQMPILSEKTSTTTTTKTASVTTTHKPSNNSILNENEKNHE